MKECPHCYKELQETVIRCKHCGEMLAADPDPSKPEESAQNTEPKAPPASPEFTQKVSPTPGMGCAVFVVAIAVLMVINAFGSITNPNPTISNDGYVAGLHDGAGFADGVSLDTTIADLERVEDDVLTSRRQMMVSAKGEEYVSTWVQGFKRGAEDRLRDRRMKAH